MPTWRQWLFSKVNIKTGLWDPLPNFEQSDFFKFYEALLTHPRLHHVAKQHGYRIAFFPHPMIRFSGLMHAFTCKNVLLPQPEASYATIFAQSKLIVTDYSSAILDFAYLRKPILYAQFDLAQFTSGAHTYLPGYFDHQNEAFGEITTTLEETVDALLQAIEQDCPLKPIYRERMDAFFAFNDKGNCERIYQSVSHLLNNEPSSHDC